MDKLEESFMLILFGLMYVFHVALLCGKAFLEIIFWNSFLVFFYFVGFFVRLGGFSIFVDELELVEIQTLKSFHFFSQESANGHPITQQELLINFE